MITVHQVVSYDGTKDASIYSRCKWSEEAIRLMPTVQVVPGTAEVVEAVDDHGRYYPAQD